MLIRNPFAGAFGLDIGDLSIKLIQIVPYAFGSWRGFRLKELRMTSLPPGLIVNGEMQEPELVRKKLLYLLGKEGDAHPIYSHLVIASLPEPQTFLKLIEMDCRNCDELNSVDISYQAKKHLPFEIDDAYLDWQVISSSGSKTDFHQVLIGAVQKTIADSYVYLMESVGLDPVALEIESVAVARSMITANKDYGNEARAILDLGATRSSLIVYDNNSIQFSTLLNFSGELVTAAIEQGLKIEHEKSEKLKITNGVKYDCGHPKYFAVVYEMVDKLCKEIKTAMTFYAEHFDYQNPISHITMCGGMANWRGLDAFISRQLKVTAQPGHPWKNLFNEKLYNFDQAHSLSLAAAIGLALRAAKNPFHNDFSLL